MRLLPSLDRELSPGAYLMAAPLLFLIPHGVVALTALLVEQRVPLTIEFWLFPLGQLHHLDVTYRVMAAGQSVGFVATWALMVLSVRRANWSGAGHLMALGTVFPFLQILAAAILAVLPKCDRRRLETKGEADAVGHILQGLFGGVAVILLAVLVGTLVFGSYGWGLFVISPFSVGLVTAYIANRETPLPKGQTKFLVLSAATLGGFALVLFALEGLICLIMAAPLAAGIALLGGAVGRELAFDRHGHDVSLMSIAILPFAFALEAASSGGTVFVSEVSTVIAAPPGRVWEKVVADGPVAVPPTIVGRAGLAYPLGSELRGRDVGAIRIGHFSTGTAFERVTEWRPGKRLTFEVLSTPPTMAEMSPYDRVHARHLEGYFEIGETQFDLQQLPHNQTRLTVRAAHRLQIEPLFYWEPIARWAIRSNSQRVLEDIKMKAEKRPPED